MRSYKTSFFTILLLFLLSTGCSGQLADANIVAFKNVNLVPMDSAYILADQTILIQDGIIREIGPASNVAIPEKAQIIEGKGRYLLPGLTDFHIHLRSTDELISYLSHGVTKVVHMSGAMSGAPDLLRYKKQLSNGEMIGPELFTTGPILDGDPPVFGGVSIALSTTSEAKQIVAEQKELGYDFIKIYNNLTPHLLTAVTDEAKAQEIAVIGHIPRKAGRDQALQQALDAGMNMIAHGEEYFFTYFYEDVDSLLDEGQIPHPDKSDIPAVVEMTQKAGAAVTPNLSFVAMTRKQLDNWEAVLADPEISYLHPEVLAMWKDQNPTNRSDLERFDKREQAKFVFLKALTKALEEGGVPLLLGTDASAPGLFPGQSAHTELHELVDAGLTPYEALATGTYNAGKFMRTQVPSTDPFGIIGVGYQADLILVEGNPLKEISNVSNIRGVMKEGRWFTRDQLNEMRQELAKKYKAN